VAPFYAAIWSLFTLRLTAHETINALSIAREEAKGMAKREGEVVDFVALHTLAISFFPIWIKELESSLGIIKCRVNAENFSGSVESVLSGASDFMLGYHHPTVPTMVDDKRYPAIKVADDTMIAVSAVGVDGLPMYSLTQKDPFPFLTYTSDSFLGRVTALILERSNLTSQTDFRYENSVSEALKSACIQGLGIAWLPTMAIDGELADGRLVRVSTEKEEAKITIKLHRSIERSRSEIERLWAFAKSREL